MTMNEQLEHPELAIDMSPYDAVVVIRDLLKDNTFSYPMGEKHRKFMIILAEALITWYEKAKRDDDDNG